MLLPTQHKGALTSTQQPMCAREGNNYIFILSFRRLLTFLHTAAEGRARTDGSHSKDRQGGRCRAWSKHLLTASLLGTVLPGPLRSSLGNHQHPLGPSASHALPANGGETSLQGLGEIRGWPSLSSSMRAFSSACLSPEEKSSLCLLCSLFSSRQIFPCSLPPHRLRWAWGQEDFLCSP